MWRIVALETDVAIRTPCCEGMEADGDKVNARRSPLELACQDTPAVDQLVMSLSDDRRIVDLWIGDGEVTLPEALGQDVHALPPVRMGANFTARRRIRPEPSAP